MPHNAPTFYHLKCGTMFAGKGIGQATAVLVQRPEIMPLIQPIVLHRRHHHPAGMTTQRNGNDTSACSAGPSVGAALSLNRPETLGYKRLLMDQAFTMDFRSKTTRT